MFLTTAQLDTTIAALREYTTRYEQPGYEQYAEEVQNGKEATAALEALREHENPHPHNAA